jgi:hypothetical protein
LYKVTLVKPLPFSRGYVHVSVHNHASLKYTIPSEGFQGAQVDAIVARIDNVGFDGPIVAPSREYEVADSLIPFENVSGVYAWADPYNPTAKGHELGYGLNEMIEGPRDQLKIPGVDTRDALSARLAFTGYFNLTSVRTNMGAAFGEDITPAGRARIHQEPGGSKLYLY